ncbi:tetratricopeptide repeat protein [Blastopirellula marina]|uniref:Tetratricopeptide repeat protein n=1 Tax=Blastopirellula marina TaxID=124 RepID=A0A2S8GN23_9BACT|nr:tetratricopeptide repeat protein [Blastopirellula marina]PQO45424.1 hypothetical protein C5Y93_13310 [Blastopirellula marina]
MFSKLPSLNYRFIALFMLAVVLLVGTVHGIHTLQVGRLADSFLREARRIRDEGRPADALGNYRRYVLIAPGDVEALAEYGELLLEVGVYDQAYFVMSRSLAIDADQDDLRLKLVDLAIAMRRYADALDYLKPWIDADADKDPELQARLAVCHAGLGEFRAAEAAFVQAVAADPDNLELYVRLATLQNSELNSYGDARATLDKMVESNPQNALAYVARGRWVLSVVAGSQQAGAVGADGAQVLEQHSFAEIQADVDKARDIAPGSLKALLLGAELSLMQQDLASAEQYAKQARQIAKNDPYPVRLLIRIASLKNNSEEAYKLAAEAAQTWPGDLTMQWMLANLLIDQGEINEALPVIQRIQVLAPEESLAQLLEARLLAVEGKWLESAKLVEEIRPQLLQWPAIASRADYHLGQCYKQLARPDQEVSAYRRALNADPNSQELRLALANSLRDSNKLDEAFDEYRTIALGASGASGEGGVVFGAIVNYFQLLIREELAKSDENALENVSFALDRLEQENPDIVFMPILRAELLFAQGEQEKAAQLINEAHAKHPELIEFLSAKVMLACQAQQWSEVDRMLAENEERFRSDPRYWMLAGKCILRQYGTEAGKAIAKLAEREALQQQEDIYPAVLSYYATVAYWVQDLEVAKSLGRKALDGNPNQLATELLLLECAFRERDLDAAQSLLAEVQIIDGQHATWHYGEAMRLALAAEKEDGSIDNEKLTKAFGQLSEAQSLRPGWSRAITFEAQLLEKQGQEDIALAHYQDAIAYGERNPLVLKHVTQMLLKRERYAEVDQLLGQLNDNGSQISSDLLHAGAEAAMQLGNLGRALQLAQDFARKSDRYEEHVWLAQLLTMLERPSEAEAALKRAIELAPDQAGPWLAIVRNYVKSGQREEAVQAMEDGQKKIAASQRDSFAAKCYEMLGEKGRAEVAYRDAIASSPGNTEARMALISFLLRRGRKDVAIGELEELLQSDLPPSAANWARRSLAMQIAADGGQQHLAEAIQLLDQNVKLAADEKQDLVARASIMASGATDESQLAAIKLLEGVGLSSLNAEQAFLLAKLYAKYNQPRRASAMLRELTIQSKADPRYLTTFVSVLISNQEEGEAQLWLSRLEEKLPYHITTIDLKVKLRVAEEEYDAIPSLLKAWIDQEAAAEEKGFRGRSNQLDWSARRLEGIAEAIAKDTPDTAIRLRDQAKEFRLLMQSPELELERAMAHAEQKQFTEAAEKLQGVIGKVSGQEYGRAASYVIAQDPDREMLTKLQAILNGSLSEYAQDLDVVSVIADIAFLKGDFAQSQELYEQVLREKPNDVRSLNNCALSMSLEGGKADEAIRLANKAVSLGKGVPPLLDTRGLAYLSGGDTERAIQDFRQAISEAPRPEYYYHLALAQSKAGLEAESNASLDAIKFHDFQDLHLHESERGEYEALVTRN